MDCDHKTNNMYRLEKELGAYLKTSSVKTCILFVNDGSKDNSMNLITEVCNRNEAFFYIDFTKNNGLSAAIKAGIDVAESPFVGYIDADLQTTPEDFELLLPHRNEFELVMGIRTGRVDALTFAAGSAGKTEDAELLLPAARRVARKVSGEPTSE